jgi:hypothetical protein
MTRQVMLNLGGNKNLKAKVWIQNQVMQSNMKWNRLWFQIEIKIEIVTIMSYTFASLNPFGNFGYEFP